MSLDIGNYVFEGPYTDEGFLDDRPGIFVVFCHRQNDYRGLDCGIAPKVKDAVKNHTRRAEWTANCQGAIEYAALYTSEDLTAVEDELRERFKFPCRDAAEEAGS